MSDTFTCIYCRREHPANTAMCPETEKALTPAHKLASTVLENRYRIKDFIGEGGMGVIYECVHLDMGKQFAVKLLNPALCESRDSYERFRREAKAAAIISHKNIVDIVDIGMTADGLPFIVMQYLEGEDLAARIFHQGGLTVRAAANILMQVLEALEAVHSVNIIHRDLKPENVFLATQSGGSEIVKILDFGISKLTGSQGVSVKSTGSGLVLGTPAYTSPEQAAGENEVDHRADLYSAAVIFYEMITGRLPFRAPAYGKLLLEIIQSPVPDPEEHLPGLPGEIKTFLLKCMSKQPDDRYQSARDMLTALRTLDLDCYTETARNVAVARVRLETKKTREPGDRPTPVQEIMAIERNDLDEETIPPTDTKPRRRRSAKMKPSAGEYRLVAPRRQKADSSPPETQEACNPPEEPESREGDPEENGRDPA
jgi:serine/threonine protein kinase